MPLPVTPDAYLGDATTLLTASAATEDPADALELAYQAALRVAGAVLAGAPVRRSAGRGAWNQIRRRAPHYAGWSDRFLPVSKIRGRLLLGLDVPVDAADVDRLRRMATEFKAEVEQDLGWLPQAA